MVACCIIFSELLLLKRLLLFLAGLVALYVCFGLWFVFASDYSDHVVIGEYRLHNRREESTLILRPDHTFAQKASSSGNTRTADGTWRLFLQDGIAFSKNFVSVSGQDRSSDGTAYGNVRKALGIGPASIELSQYHILWYGRKDASTSTPIAGTYVGDDEHAASTLLMKADHTFEEAVTREGQATHANGTWTFDSHGEIVFSKQFLDVSGQAIASGKTASASNPAGSDLQIVVTVNAPEGAPIFHKRLFR